MDPRRASTERNMLPDVGPVFFRENGEVMFRFVIDSGNVVGPRPATRRDQDQHPAAWSAFAAAEGVSGLDRDARGGSGGSLPAEPESPSVAVEVSTVAAEPEPPPKRKYTRRKKG